LETAAHIEGDAHHQHNAVADNKHNPPTSPRRQHDDSRVSARNRSLVYFQPATALATLSSGL
jgi:hypothetical protein